MGLTGRSYFTSRMLDTLITNKTRIKLLFKFFLNSNSRSWLRSLESEFDESTNAIRIELNRFEQAGLLVSSMEGNRKMFQANKFHPLFQDLQNLMMKYVGFDQIIEKVARKLGGLERVYLIGNLARGNDTKTIQLMFVGRNIDEEYLIKLTDKTSHLINRKIGYLIYTPEEEIPYRQKYPEALLIWEA